MPYLWYLKAIESDRDSINQMESKEAKDQQVSQASEVASVDSTKTSQPYCKPRLFQSKGSYHNPFTIEAYRRDWEKREKEFKELKLKTEI